MTDEPTRPIDRARTMRKAMTPPEARLWVELRKLRARGFHFRRQAPFRGYYLDFVCFDRRVAVEVDGQMHHLRGEHDRIRDAVLAREGFVTIRFDNATVRDSLREAVEHLLTVLAQRHPTRPPLRGVHPPHEGEGE